MEVEAFWETELERQPIQACRTVPPNIEIIETQIRQGADPNSHKMHRTVFTSILEAYGVALGDGYGMDGTVGGLHLPAIVSLLLKHSADPNLFDEAGQIWPLDEMIWCAADNDSLHAAELLQRYGARKWMWDYSPYSRMLCDLERFRDDALEPMTRKGMGAVYTSLSNGETLRHLTMAERAQMLRELYDPHNEALSQLAMMF